MDTIDINRTRKSNALGAMHDQIIHFDNGEKRVIQGVMFIWENQMLHIVDYLGVEWIINKARVLYSERISRGGEGYGKVDAGRSGKKDSKVSGSGKSGNGRNKQVKA